MNTLKNRISALVLSGTMLISSANIVFGAEQSQKLDKIVELGIIQGEGTGIDGSQPLSRYRGISLQLKLMGLWEALADYDSNGKDTFNDAHKYSPFVQKLLSYIKNTPSADMQGYPDGTFKPLDYMTIHEFINITLSSLGYKNGTDFNWVSVPSFAVEIGLISSADKVTNKAITINEASEIIYDALLLEGSSEKEGNFGEEIGFIIEDTRGPQIEFFDIPEVTHDEKIKLKGSIDEKGTLKINNTEIKINDELKFQAVIPLNIGENIIKTETLDENGNISKKDYKIERISNEVIVDSIQADSLKMAKVTFNTQLDPSTIKAENFKIKDLEVGKVKLANDNKTVLVMLAENSIFNQQEEHIFESIQNVKSSIGNTMAKVTDMKFYVSDTEKPVVESVGVEKNNEIRITFSEPIKEEHAANVSNYELNGKRFIGTIKGYDYDTILLHSTNVDLKNELKISNIRDFSNLVMNEQTFKFEYDEDKTGPEIEEVTDITLESIKIRFNEKIDFNSVNKDNIKWSYTLSTESGKNATDVEKVDDRTIIVHFKGDNSLSPTRINIIVNAIEDLSGNKINDNSYTNIKASIDETKPEINSVISTHEGNASKDNNGTTKIAVEFTKPVLNVNSSSNFNENFIIKDNNEKILNKTIKFKDYQNSATNIIEFTIDDLPSGQYNLIVKDFKDDTKYPNVMLESEHKFNVENKKTPEVSSIYFEENNSNDKLYIQFSESMNDTIIDIDKYMVKKNDVWKKLSNEINGSISTKNNNTYAIFALNGNIEDYQELEISFVENSAGNVINQNKVSFNLQDRNIVKNITTMSPSIKYAEITEKNQIKIYLDRELSDAYFKDFWITNPQREISQNVYHDQTSNLSFETIPVKESSISTDINENGNTDDTLTISVVTINYTNDVFTSTGKFVDGNDVIVSSNSEKILHTSDMLDNKLIESSSNALDKISPNVIAEENKIYTNEDNKKAVLYFDENINIENKYEAYAANDIVIKDEQNNNLTSGIDYIVKSLDGALEITFLNPFKNNLTINSSDSMNFIKDLNGNTINKFDSIIVIKN